MPGQNHNRIEHPQPRSRGARERDPDGVRIDAGERRKDAVDPELVPRGRGDLGICHDLKRKQHVVGAKRRAVGETEAAAEMERVAPAIL